MNSDSEYVANHQTSYKNSRETQKSLFTKIKTNSYRFKNAFEGVIINAIPEWVVHCIVFALSCTNVLRERERDQEKNNQDDITF